MPDLCPEIFRKRAMVEGRYGISPPDSSTLGEILLGLSHHMGMHPLSEPLLFSPDEHSDLHHGIAGFIPWVESGCSLYTWSNRRFFTLEIYSCKDFNLEQCRAFMQEQLLADPVQARVLSVSVIGQD